MRPEWTKLISGIAVDCVVRLHGGLPGAKQDLIATRNRISVVRPGALQPKPEDEHEVSFTYGPEATNKDILDRTVTPLLVKLLEGYNVTVVAFGATGSGKTTTLEGTKARAPHTGEDGAGLVHLAVAQLFQMLHSKAVLVGEAIAKKRRMPSSKGYDFFIESSFTEVYNEQCHDLLAKGAEAGASLPVVEDVHEGWTITGVTIRPSRTPEELRACFDMGRSNRNNRMMDLGSIHERSCSIFTIHVSQYAPAAVHGEEDRVMVSKLTFVDMPGSERLAMDPEVLRLREGPQLNKPLVAFASCLRTLAQEGSVQFVDYQQSVLTQILSDALGGNCLTTIIGTARQGEWEVSSTTLKHLTTSRGIKTYPIINHSRVRGLIHKLRYRLMTVLEDREALRDQLNVVPVGLVADPTDLAVAVGKVRDLEARLLEEREEKGHLGEEKQALQARLAKLKEAASGDVQDRAELQAALVRSEEQRLEISRVLIDLQLEYNDAQIEYHKTMGDLESKLLELEGAKVDGVAKQHDLQNLKEQLEKSGRELTRSKEESTRLRRQLDMTQEQLGQSQKEVHRLSGLMAALESAGRGESQALMSEQEAYGNYAGGVGKTVLKGAESTSSTSSASAGMLELRSQLQHQLRLKERQIHNLEQEVKELQQELDKTKATCNVTQMALNELRQSYQKKLEGHAREVADLSRRVLLTCHDPQSPLRVNPEELTKKLVQLLDDLGQLHAERSAGDLEHLDELFSRHVELKRKFKLMYNGYRKLRHRLQDEWPGPGNPPHVPQEDAVANGALEEVLRFDEDSNKKTVTQLREVVKTLGEQLDKAKVAGTLAAMNGASSAQERGTGKSVVDDGTMIALQLENDQLRQELDRIRRRATTSAGASRANAATAELESLRAQVAELSRKEEAQVQQREAMKGRTLETGRNTRENNMIEGADPNPGSRVESHQDLRKQIREFTLNTQMELERKLQNAESRAVMAEEQLDQLEQYMAQVSVTYQREIVRLRAQLGALDPTGSAVRTLEEQGIATGNTVN